MTIWECNSPESLLDLSARHCVTNLRVLKAAGLNEGQENRIHLPTEIGERLLEVAQEEGIDLDDSFAEIFRHMTRVIQ